MTGDNPNEIRIGSKFFPRAMSVLSVTARI